ncbi:MAG: pilus assembly protein PilX [Clostridia bacterium]|nr:pilus assembly protein PilX [Clostridia bacterium]
MRKLNVFLVIGIFATFLIHAITGGLKLAGADLDTPKAVSWICVGFIIMHVIVTVILTFQTLEARRKSSAGYFKDNILFWVRRISGFAVLIPLVMHIAIFRSSNADAYRLQVFTTGRMISQILLVATLALHILTNIRPLMISLGIRDTKSFAADFLLILSILLLLFAAAFAIYYLRWAAY